jgi:nitroreductase
VSSPSDAETIARLIATRFSCRAFLPDPVPEHVILRIIDVARQTASWSNTQPWEIVVTRTETTRNLANNLEALANAQTQATPDVPFPPGFAGVYLERRREVGFGLYAALGIAREDRAAREAQHLKNFRFFGAPHVAILTIPAGMGAYGALDLGGFLTSFLLAAEAEGVATIAQASLAAYGAAIRALLAIADDRALLCGISFGYPDLADPANIFRSSRAPREQIFRFA